MEATLATLTEAELGIARSTDLEALAEVNAGRGAGMTHASYTRR